MSRKKPETFEAFLETLDTPKAYSELYLKTLRELYAAEEPGKAAWTILESYPEEPIVEPKDDRWIAAYNVASYY